MKIIKPNNVYIDTELSLKSEFVNDKSDTLLILGPGVFANKHKFNYFKTSKSNKVIVFNQAQLGQSELKRIIHFGYYTYLRLADEVWDYDEYNIQVLKTIRPDVKLHLLKPCELLNAGSAEKDIDVLFYGLINERRQHIIDKLTAHNIKVFVANGLWGDKLNPYIARAKICLNVHYYPDTALQEQARMIRWISSGAHVLSECSRHNYMGIPEVTYDNIVPECMRILHLD